LFAVEQDVMRKEAVRQPVKNVAFPLTQKAVKKLQDFRAGKCNFVELVSSYCAFQHQ